MAAERVWRRRREGRGAGRVSQLPPGPAAARASPPGQGLAVVRSVPFPSVGFLWGAVSPVPRCRRPHSVRQLRAAAQAPVESAETSCAQAGEAGSEPSLRAGKAAGAGRACPCGYCWSATAGGVRSLRQAFTCLPSCSAEDLVAAVRERTQL